MLLISAKLSIVEKNPKKFPRKMTITPPVPAPSITTGALMGMKTQPIIVTTENALMATVLKFLCAIPQVSC